MSDGGNDPVWLWEDGKTPEDLSLLTANTAASARALLKQIYRLNDALSAARREKDSDGPLIDRVTTEFGIFVARAEQISAVWDLFDTNPPEDEAPLAKWIERRVGDKNDYVSNATPISGAAQLAGGLWRRARC